MKKLIAVLAVPFVATVSLVVTVAGLVFAAGSGPKHVPAAHQFNWLAALVFVLVVLGLFNIVGAFKGNGVSAVGAILCLVVATLTAAHSGLSLQRDTDSGRLDKAMTYCRGYHNPNDSVMLAQYGACVYGYDRHGHGFGGSPASMTKEQKVEEAAAYCAVHWRPQLGNNDQTIGYQACVFGRTGIIVGVGSG